MTIRVIKIGGSMLGDAAALDAVGAAVAALGEGVVVVHGGGPAITAAQSALGVAPQWHEGLRVTDALTLRAATWALSGEVNKRLVAALVDHGVDALGVSGEDGGLLRAELTHGGRCGRTGEVVAVRTALLRHLLDAGLTPVVSPISRGPDGAAVNVNADAAAAAIAAALRADELVLLSDVPAVRGATGALAQLSPEQAEELIALGIATDGMVPKLRAASAAVARGVAAVRIAALAGLGSTERGTRMVATQAVGAVA